MKPLLLLAIFATVGLVAVAQEPKPAETKAPEPAAKEDGKKEDGKKDSAAAPAPAESPVPSSTESWISGTIDLGYRWRTDVGGSFDTYRTLVNLGSGPKLLGADFTLTDPKHRVFDVVHVRATSWGDDPYSTFHLDARKSKRYEFNADYRDFAYFNVLPSFADPLLSRGIVLSEQSFDTRRRFASLTLDLLPGNWYIPYFAYDRDSSSGTGASVFVATGNEYPVPTRLSDSTNLFRGGVRFELRRFHVTLEQGGTTYSDDQSLYQNPGSTNYGNLGSLQKLDITSLLATYGITGNSIYSKGLFTANPKTWVDLYGQFLYSQPTSDVSYQQSAAGVLQNQFLYYGSQQFLLSAAAKMPHTTASFGAEIRPVNRIRVVESWLTDRLHNAGSAASTSALTTPGSLSTAALLASSLATNYSQEEVDVFFDATSKILLRGGYRYVWGDAADAILPAAGLASSDQGKLRRNVGLGAITYRPRPKLSLTAETEVASSSGTYFRTSLYDYQKVRAQARYAATSTLTLAADVIVLDNQNPTPGLNYDYRASQASLSFLWSPAKAKAFNFQGSYTRSTVHSNIGFLTPQDGTQQLSLYRDNEHIGSGLFNWTAPHSAARVSAGGSFFVSAGSRPTSYFQPLASVHVPLGKKISWFGEWRYYGYGEAFYLYEGFRTHLVTTGLRFTR